MFFRKRPRPANRAQGDLLAGTVHFKCVAGLEVQLFPQRLRDDDAACFIYDEACGHPGTILWVDPSVNTILPLCLAVHLIGFAGKLGSYVSVRTW
jgi:hypothetical protein